ncbi:hypothetical protein SEPB62_16256 [Salmonella enterica subsp. enterica serovar Paratyphi B str. SARA62]|nr:hypothetical protein SEPB62_16256 [Salmonella enterica subsp. enterica serovar Paratyphi B str. SARA62]
MTGKSRDDLQAAMALVRAAIWASRSSSKTSAIDFSRPPPSRM